MATIKRYSIKRKKLYTDKDGNPLGGDKGKWVSLGDMTVFFKDMSDEQIEKVCGLMSFSIEFNDSDAKWRAFEDKPRGEQSSAGF